MANEMDKLDPIPESVTLRSGLVVQLESLKARQFFKLLRIITHGALPGMREAGLFDMDGLDTDEFMGKLLSVTLLSIPDAEDETIEFIRSMCYPYGLIERKGLNKQDVDRNKILWEALDEELENPDLDDLVTILEAVVKRESEDIQALGKRLASMFKLAEKTGQISPQSSSPSPPESTSASSAGSPARSTSSRRSTGGRTKSSSTARSVESVSTSLQSESDSTMPVGSVSNG
jgi:hypothetical protein